MPMNYFPHHKVSSRETDLAEIMRLDAAVIAERWRVEDEPRVIRRKPHSAETRAKLAAAASRRTLSAETRAKIGATQSIRRAQQKLQPAAVSPVTKPGRTSHG